MSELPEDASEKEHDKVKNVQVPPGFTMCWDNVGKYSTARHQSTQSQNKMHNWALAYAAINRVPTTDLDHKDPELDAIDIDLGKFMPSPNEIDQYKDRLIVMVERILVKHVKIFRDNFSDCVTKHIRHEKSSEMKEKSELVSMM